MGQSVSTFFTATAIDVAKNAWSSVVHGLNTFANWLGKEVKSFVNSVIDGITTIVGKVKQFFISVWDNIEEFTNRIFGLKPSLKDALWTDIYHIGDGIRNAGIQHMRERLKAMSYSDVDRLTDDQVVEKWNQYMSQHPPSPEDQKELDDMLNGTSDSTSTRAYSTLRSLPTNAYGGTIPQESGEIKLKRDRVITHITLVLLHPEQLKMGLPKPFSLAPDEEKELHLMLST